MNRLGVLVCLISGMSVGQVVNPGGGTTYTGTTPIVVTGSVISCPTCGSGSFVALTGDATSTATGGATTVLGLNGTLLSGLATGILENTTGTGVPNVVAAPTGAVVGTTDSQTLTNKSIVATQLTGTLQAAQEPAHTGDVTNTAGSLALTIAANAVTGAKMANNTVTATQLAAQYSKSSCMEVWGGSGTSFALTSGDDAISNNSCYNDSGVTRTITAVKCFSDNGSNTTTINPTFGASGTGTTILSGALTCGNSNAMSSTGTVSNASWTTGSGVNPAMSGTLTGTHIGMIVEFTF